MTDRVSLSTEYMSLDLNRRGLEFHVIMRKQVYR